MIRIAAIVCCALSLAACAGQSTSLPSAPPPGEPAGYAGIDAAQLKVAMGGDPAFVRKDGDVQVWRYDGASCKAFFFLYPQGTDISVRHVETLPRPSDAAADLTCLTRLRGGAKAVS